MQIIGNVHLSGKFQELAKELGVSDPKVIRRFSSRFFLPAAFLAACSACDSSVLSLMFCLLSQTPEDIYKTHLTEGGGGLARRKDLFPCCSAARRCVARFLGPNFKLTYTRVFLAYRADGRPQAATGPTVDNAKQNLVCHSTSLAAPLSHCFRPTRVVPG